MPHNRKTRTDAEHGQVYSVQALLIMGTGFVIALALALSMWFTQY